jgi:VWFA-related protein
MRRLIAAFLLYILPSVLCSPGMAQTEGTTTLKVDVKTVLLPVTVRDKHGKLIEKLTKTDFALTEDNKAEAINYFATNANLPLTLGLLVDTSMSVRSVLPEEKTASQHFLEQMMSNEKDRAFVIQFDRQVELLQDLTSSKDKLRKALDEVGTAPPAPQDTGTGDPDDTSSGSGQPRARRGGGTQLYDAIYLAANEVMSKQQGRKALIVLTDGEDRGSKESLNAAIEAAQRANTTIYAIYFKGEGHGGGGSPGGGHHGGGGYPGGGGGYPGGGGRYPGGGGGYPGGGGGYPGGGGGHPRGGGDGEPRVDGKKVLQQMCGETGGAMFEAKKQKFDEVYTTIAEELRNQYVLGYTPEKSEESGYHKLGVTVAKKDLIVQTRAGYYAGQ